MQGSTVGAYRLLNQIGEGGMGAVWLAEHTMLGRRAAVKLLHQSFSGREDIVQRFFNEARAATSISDPGIVQIFDFGHQPDGQAYIVMELLEGEPLDKRLQRDGRLPVEAALRIMRQVASSLGAAHARGIVHRDLKPENIFMVPDPEVAGGERAKILDFGIAKLGENSGVKTQTNALMGTPSYMSPEQCRGAGKLDARSDVYALGCVMFALITGHPPFVAEGHGEMIVMHITQEAPLLSSRAPGVSPALDALVAKCLLKEPEKRYANGKELAAAIGQALAGGSQTSVQNAVATPSGYMPTPVPGTLTTGNTGLGLDGQMTSTKEATGPGLGVATAKTSTTLSSATTSNSVLTTREGKPNKLIIGGLVGLAAVGGAIAVVMATGGKSKDKPADTQVAAAPTPTPTPTPDPKPEEKKPEVKAPEVKPEEKTPEVKAPEVKPEEEKLSIPIESTPPGAQVFVGTEATARGKTPYTLEVKKGDPAFEIKLVAKGYTPGKKKVTPGTDTKVDVTLAKIRTSGGGTGGGTTKPEDSDDTMNPFAKKGTK